jgi:hypothetical protein
MQGANGGLPSPGHVTSDRPGALVGWLFSRLNMPVEARGDSGASYEVTGTAIAELPKIENFKAELDATVQEFIKTVDYDAFGTLQSYAITRCNFSMFISDTDNLDAAPDTADIAKLLADVDAAAEADAKIQFPPLPPKSATWPRKDRYIGVAKSLGNNPVVQP